MRDWSKLSTQDFLQEISRQGVVGLETVKEQWANLPWRLKVALYLAQTHDIQSVQDAFKYDANWFDTWEGSPKDIMPPKDEEFLEKALGYKLAEYIQGKWQFLLDIRLVIAFLREEMTELAWLDMANSKIKEAELKRQRQREARALKFSEAGAESVNKAEEKLYQRDLWHEKLDKDALLTDKEWQEAWEVCRDDVVILHENVPVHMLEKWMKEGDEQNRMYILSHVLSYVAYSGDRKEEVPAYWTDWALASKSEDVQASALADKRLDMEKRRIYRASTLDEVCERAWEFGEVSLEEKRGELSTAALQGLANRDDCDEFIYDRILTEAPQALRWQSKLPRWVKLRLAKQGHGFAEMSTESDPEILAAIVESHNTESWQIMADAIRPEWGDELALGLLERIVQIDGDRSRVERIMTVGGVTVDRALIGLLLQAKSKDVRELGMQLAGQLGEPKRSRGQKRTL